MTARWVVMLAAGVALGGCDAVGDGSGDGSGGGRDGWVDGGGGSDRGDAMGDRGHGSGGSDGGGLDGAGFDGAGFDDGMLDDRGVSDTGSGDGSARDGDSPPPLVVDCGGACDRFVGCGRVESFGDRDGCLAACDRASREGAPTGWFECLSAEGECGLIHLCRLPEPPPLSCDAVCAGLDRCGIEGPWPDCIAECAAQNAVSPGEPAFSACGEAVVGACDAAGWWQCYGDRVDRACARRCVVAVECERASADDCLVECITGRVTGDALQQHRHDQRTRCIGFAGDDCGRVDDCLGAAVPTTVDRVALCRAWDACFAAEGFFCADLDAFADERPGFLPCIDATLQAAGAGGGAGECAGAAFDVIGVCFSAEPPRGPRCGELCEARVLCGEVAERDRQACVVACGEALDGDAFAAERQAALLRCGAAASCPGLAACEGDTVPGVACAADCAARAGCGAVDAECEARCDDGFFRPRQIAARECVRDAVDCDGIAACDPGEPVGCVEQCDRNLACGIVTPQCLDRCDDEQHGDPVLGTARLACLLAAPLCHRGRESVARCGLDALASGGVCLGWCRAEVGCEGITSALVGCLERCGDGFEGIEGERFAAARGCLEVTDVDDCPALAACLPPAGAVECDAGCAVRAACGLGDAVQCADACATDALARLRAAEQSACLAAADDCAGVAACATPEAEEPPTAGEVCARYLACGFDDDFPCANIIADLGDREGFLTCLDDAINPCPADPFDAIHGCRVAQPDEVAGYAECRQMCAARAQCEAGAPSIRDCAAACVDGLGTGAGASTALLPCAAAATCAEFAACAAERLPERACGPYCARLAGCGLAPVGCEQDCEGGFYRARQVARRDCTAAIGESEDGDDCAAIGACDPGDARGCEAQCERTDRCGYGDPECVEGCDDSAFVDPIGAARRLACIMAAPLCFDAFDALSRCMGGAPVGGAACLGWCRARAGCGAPDSAALAGCIVECGRGFAGDEGIAFEEARGCLEAAGGGAGCDAIEACLAPAAVVDCAGWCAGLAACGRAPADCEAVCAGDGLARWRAVTQSECLGDAIDCAAVDACVASVIPAPVDRVGLCADWDRCGLAAELFIACDVLVDGLGLSDEALRCFQAGVEACPDDAAALLDRCVANENDPAALAPCRRLCAVQGRCGASSRDCIDECVASMFRDPFGAQGRRLGCAEALTCDALAGCLREAGAGEPCDAVCAAAVACGAFADRGACLDRCGAALVVPWVPAGYVERAGACLAALEAGACAAEGAACFELTPDCEAVCTLFVGCDLQDPDGFDACVLTCRGNEGWSECVGTIAASMAPPARCVSRGLRCLLRPR